MTTRSLPAVSFEVFPPRSEAARARLFTTLDQLATVTPGFVSVTYGASGSTQQATRDVVTEILKKGDHTPLVHLTCIGRNADQLREIITDFLNCGARRFLALRGDPPAGEPDWSPQPGALTSAAQLVALIREVAADVVPGQGVTVAVAAFPTGNAGVGTSRAQDIAGLLDKQLAGADFAITQLFYRAADYFNYVAQARAAGVILPIVPGILPPTDPARLDRVAQLSGVPAPADLQAELYAAAAADSPDQVETALRRHSLGVAFTVDLIRTLLDGGAPGIHLYTFNQHRAVLDVLCALRLLTTNQPLTATAGGNTK